MQTAMTLVFLGWGALLGSGWVIGAAAMAIVYSAGIAAWDEGRDLHTRFGDRWTLYRRHVRPWWPRWRPFVMAEKGSLSPTPSPKGEGLIYFGLSAALNALYSSPARLYVAASCGQCSTIGRWLQAREPIGLTFVPAEEHPSRDLWRVTYDPADGTPDEEGVAAIGRALEHINFAWAFAGMAMRLPLVCAVLQMIIDASGGGPQRIRRMRGMGACAMPAASDVQRTSSVPPMTRS
jgi:hypothetical protein